MPVDPEGYRRLKLTYIEPIPVNCIGVYCLFFGNHFYIGKSTNVRARLGSHRLQIDRLLWRTLSGKEPKVVGSYIRIVQHLIENTDIVSMDAMLLYIARSEEDALSEEWCWLNFLQSYVLNYRCRNKMEYLAEYPTLGDLHWGQECFVLSHCAAQNS